MNFKDWVLSENTISQILKQKYKDQYKKLYKGVFAFVRSNLQNLSEESSEVLAKWYSFNYFKYLKDNDLGDTQSTYRMFFYPNGQAMALDHADYLASKSDETGNLDKRLKSKFNNPDFSIENLDKLVEFWHASLESKKRTPGAEGSTIIDLSNPIEPKNISLLGPEWEGWKWVDLDKGYCDIESKSMGHCGNSGAKGGDTILSLRDENNIPHLTFILNDGKLGEMKGRNNSKPSKKYHPAIVELLKHDWIKQVVGGGYKPENNFMLSDLEDDIKDQLVELKPDLEFDIYEDMEKKMKEIREEWDVDSWTFVSEYSDLEDAGDGNPYIYMSGNFYTTIKAKLIKGLPGFYGDDRVELRKLKNLISDESRVYFHIEDLELEEDKNGISIKGQISYDSYGGDEMDRFEEFIQFLAQDVEPYEEEFKNLVQRILVKEGYISPYYVQQVTKESGKIGWGLDKFKNFNWSVSEPDFKTSHDIHIKIFDTLKLGEIKNNFKEMYDLGTEFKEKMEKYLENELELIALEFWKNDKQKTLFQKQKNQPAYTSDMKIKPNMDIRLGSDRKNWSMAWDPKENPVLSFNPILNGYVEITQMNTYEEAKKAEKMLHFIDNNYNYILNRLIKRFEKESNEYIKLETPKWVAKFSSGVNPNTL